MFGAITTLFIKDFMDLLYMNKDLISWLQDAIDALLPL